MPQVAAPPRPLTKPVDLGISFALVLFLSLACCLLLLFHSWNNYLTPRSGAAVFWYDPYRFYFYAQTVAAKGLDLNELRRIAQNYNGVILYYAGIFLVFGVSSWGPAVINLLALAVVVRAIAVYVVKDARSRAFFAFVPLILLNPDLLWHATMTGKELPTVTLVAYISLVLFRYMRRDVGSASLVLAGVAMLVLVSVRASVILIPLGTILIYTAMTSQRGRLRLAVVIGLVLAALLVAPTVNEHLGSAVSDPSSVITGSINRYSNLLEHGGLRLREDSISRFLYTGDPLLIILTLPLKILWYLVTPLPNFPFSLHAVLRGDWTDVQSIVDTLSAVLNIVLLPYVLFTTKAAFDPRYPPQYRDAAIFFFALLLGSLAAVLLTGIELHTRFRLLFLLPYMLLASLSIGICSQSLARLKLKTYASIGIAFAAYWMIKAPS